MTATSINFNMKPFLLIREAKSEDEHRCKQVIRDYIMNYVWKSYLCCVLKEITIQCIVIIFAILFIFLGVPLAFCFLSIPGCILLMFFCVYASSTSKAMEVSNCKPKLCWIVESFEPYSFNMKPDYNKFESFDSYVPYDENIRRSLKRNIIATASVKNHNAVNNSAWLCRIAVDPNYKFDKIAEPLISSILKHCFNLGFTSAELVTIEWQEEERELYTKLGFITSQIYHKTVIGNSLTIMKGQMGINLNNLQIDKTA